MNRREFIAGAASLGAAQLPGAGRPGLEDFGAGPADSMGASADAAMTAGPDLSRLHLTLQRVLHGSDPAYTPDFLLEDIRATPGRRFTNFCGDLSGRWIGAVATTSRTFGGSVPNLDEVVRRTIALQHAEGYFGGGFHEESPDDDDLALLWGNGRLLVGLMEYHGLTGNAVVLESAKRLGDFLVRIAPRFNSQAMADAFSADHYASSYICWTQQTEGLAALYAVTRDERYREVAAEISRRNARRPGDHVHGYLTSLRGTLALYEASGDAQLLQQVMAAWRDVVESGDVLITGGVPERWTPKRERTEGCAEADWLRLNLALYRVTGERGFLESAQNTYFNEFCMNQFATGDFGHARLDPSGVPQVVAVRAWWCCTLHGLRAFADVQNAAFRVAGKQVIFEFPIDGHVDRDGFSARAISRLTTDGTVGLEIARVRADQTLTITRPVWADEMSVARNGAPVTGLTVERLAAGDVVAIQYGMGLRTTPWQGAAEKQVLHFGPWLLGVTASVDPYYFNELYAANQLELPGVQARVAGSTFQVPVAARSVRYRPAEFPEQPGTVELRAVAEQTAYAPAEWQLVFATQPKQAKATQVPPLRAVIAG
jgi:hypothetical protein